MFGDIRIGDIVNARVTEVRDDGKLTLSAREKSYIQMDTDADRIMEALNSHGGTLPFSDSASPEVIRQELGMSKNAFKRAAGRLYKDRKIIIEDTQIRRV